MLNRLLIKNEGRSNDTAHSLNSRKALWYLALWQQLDMQCNMLDIFDNQLHE